MEINIRVPRVPSGTIANLIGLAGLLGIALAVGALAGSWWWSLLAGSVFAVALSYVAQTHEQAERAAETARPAAAEAPRTAARARAGRAAA